MVEDLKKSPNGGLLLISKGLGLYHILAKFLDTFNNRASTLIFLLNFSDDEIAEITKLRTNDAVPLMNVSAELAPKRTKLYLQGGIYAVSSWVILLDLLQPSQLPISVVSGFIVNNVEETDRYSDRESWATTMLRVENQKAFI